MLVEGCGDLPHIFYVISSDELVCFSRFVWIGRATGNLKFAVVGYQRKRSDSQRCGKEVYHSHSAQNLAFTSTP